MDILSIVSVVNIFGFIFVMDHCVRKRIKITLPVILFWVLFVMMLAVIVSMVSAILYGQQLTTDAMGTLFANIIGMAIAFFVLDIVIFFIARILYKKIPSISAFLGHDAIAQEGEEKKHMSKIIIYTHEKPGSQEFESIKADAEKLMKEHTSLDTLEIEKGTENVVSRRKHKKSGGG